MQFPLFDFEGMTYDRKLDQGRLSTQLDRVKTILERGSWYTLKEISHETGFPEASVSARIRDLRKPHKYGLHVARMRVPGERGLWKYRLLKDG